MKIKNKIIATIILTIMISSNLLSLGSQVIAVSKQLQNQNSKTNIANVEFNSYLEGNTYEKTYEVSETGKLCMVLRVKEKGYLKNGIIELIDTNFKVDSSQIESKYIQKIENETIYLSQIQSEEEVLIELPITFKKSAQINSDYFEKEVNVSFKASYVDGNGKERKVEKVVTNKVNWKAEPEIEITGEVSKYIPYHEGEEYGLLVQSKIIAGIKENLVPIKNTKIELEVPKINETEPERVTVIANSTKGTNGKENGNSFGKENYEYIKEEGKVVIQTTNEAQEEKMVWGEGKDEYIVTYVYTGEEVYAYANEELNKAKEGKVSEKEKQEGKVNEEAITGQLLIKASIEVYNAEKTLIEKDTNLTYTIEEKKGNLSEIEVTSPEEISKAYLYANYDKKEGKQETTYDLTYKANIYDSNINKEIEYEIKNDKVVINEEKYTAGNNIYVKEIKISEENFLKLLGEEGKIEITRKDGTLVGEITKESKKDENGNYIIDVVEEINKAENNSENQNIPEGQEVNSNTNEKEVLSELIIRTSKPISEGTIEIKVTKEISTEHNYTKEEMKKISSIETEAVARTNTETKTLKSAIKLNEVTNKAEISIQAESLSTVVINKDVQIRAILDTSSLENALYKNPIIRIKLPAYISNVNIKSADILMENGLKIKNVKGDSENGSPVIVVELEGTQTDYTIGAEYKGTIVILNTDITVKTLTPTNENKIEMTYRNENEVVKEKEGKVETKVNFVAPTGVVTANAISNYANNKKALMTISAETLKAEIETYKEKKEATVTGTIVNNYGNKISNIKILGRIPSKENKGIDGEEVESTFDAKMVTEIKVTGLENYKVYYSNKADATENLADANNSWEEKYTNEAKSYLIVAEESYEMEEHKTIEFSYNIEIPANLSYNNNSYEMYKVYYTNVSEVGKIGEEKNSPVLQLSTGEGPELKVTLQSTADIIKEGQIVKMKVTVENTGDMAVTDAEIRIPKPENAKFVSYTYNLGFSEQSSVEKIISIGTVEPGETINANYYIKMENRLEENAELVCRVSVEGKEMANGIPSNEYKNTIKEGKIQLELIGSSEENVDLLEGQEIECQIKVNNISNEKELHNVVVNIPLLTGTKYKSASIKESGKEEKTDGITYNEKTNAIEVNIETLNTLEQIIKVNLEVQEFDGLSTMMAVAKIGGEEHYSNLLEYRTNKISVLVSELTSTPRYVKEGESITYKFDITNTGKMIAQNIKIQDVIPSELLFVELSYSNDVISQRITQATNNIAKATISQLSPGESVTVKIIAKAKTLPSKEEKQIENSVTVSLKYGKEAQTNIVKNIIEYNEELHEDPSTKPEQKPSTGENTPTTSKYKITGTAWLDENRNGKREDTEQLLANIPVVLLNKSNNTIVTDIDTKAEKRTTTSANGSYEFTNIPNGQYLVLFLYDASKYSLTSYQAEGIDESANSDAIDINLVFDGERRLAGITNVVEVNNSNSRDIDIGLYVAEKFDLRLDKYISKITLTTPTIGTQVTNYNNTQLARVEILQNNVNKSSILVEYKIKVTNEGQVAGYAKKLIDYLPEDASFNSEVNNEWYLSDNNQNVYNTSLANTVIKPGESKEVSLILSFNITDKNIGNIVNNNAEIYESYNEQGVEDIDSIEANKVSQEDDISKADIILSVVTGKIVVGSILILVILALLVFGIIEIKKRVLTKKNQ